jgi:hypothetical protein
MHWTWDAVQSLPVDVYEVLLEELVKERERQQREIE